MIGFVEGVVVIVVIVEKFFNYLSFILRVFMR